MTPRWMERKLEAQAAAVRAAYADVSAAIAFADSGSGEADKACGAIIYGLLGNARASLEKALVFDGV